MPRWQSSSPRRWLQPRPSWRSNSSCHSSDRKVCRCTPLVTEATGRSASGVSGHIGRHIAAAGGLIGFDEFMRLALYAPRLGYYAGGAHQFGRSAADGSDFVTAPELSPLFGRALAHQVAQICAASAPAVSAALNAAARARPQSMPTVRETTPIATSSSRMRAK